MTSFPTIDIAMFQPLYSNHKLSWGETRDIYLIPLNLLHLNKDNGRIASYVAGYENAPGKKPFAEMDLEEWNDVLSTMVFESAGKDKNAVLKDSILKSGQRDFGLIYDDGTIISGNRRFSTLRAIVKGGEANPSFNYFACGIEPAPKDPVIYARRLKELETLSTYGVLPSEKYGPIERLVDAYRSALAPDAPYTEKTYARFLGDMTKAKIRQLFGKARILVDYLDFIGQPFNYEIARVNELDGPIQELDGIMYSLRNCEREWHRIKPLFYYYLWKGPASTGDKTRNIRPLKELYKSGNKNFEYLLKQVEEAMITGDWNIVVPSDSEKSKGTGVQGKPTKTVDELVNEEATKEQIRKAKRKPLETIGGIQSALNTFDLQDVEHMEAKDKETFFREVDRIIAYLSSLRKGE